MKEFDPEGQSPSIASVTDRVRPVAIGMPVIAAYFIGDRAAFVGAEESVTLINRDGEKSVIAVHAGAILSSTCEGARIVTGGDDGKVVAVQANGAVTAIATDPKRRWIDNVAL